MSTPEDPKETLKTLLHDNLTLLKDDELTPATVLVCDEFNEEFWKKYDVIITCGLVNTREQLANLGGTLRQVIADYRVGVWTRDTAGITGQKMRWKTVQGVTQIVNAQMKSPGGILNWMRLASCTDADRTDLKPVLYHSDILVETHRMENV
ncbi:MAG TPA: hypothetical protein VMS95_03575 [Candidatus Krumholzibacteriaceae bacterium]|jgi:hypothetical protein|nr:hypothetical protein [Candidatus Krumholzibacteriaceae bacterium]